MRETLRVAALTSTTFLLMLPVTLPVPVLGPLVQHRFALSEGETSLFNSANMLGALLAAPLVGLLADRGGRRRTFAVAALLLDGLLMLALARADSYGAMLALRCVEGMAHIAALSLVLAIAADLGRERRGRVLGSVGGGLTLGVALGAAIGGRIGKHDPTLTLEAASVCLAVAAAVAFVSLPAEGRPTARPSTRAIAGAVLKHRALVVPLAFAFVDRFTVGFFTTGFPLLLRNVHGSTSEHIGMLLASFLLPFALLSYPFGRIAERWRPMWLVAIGSALYGLGTMLVGALDPALFWGLMPLLGVASAVMFVPNLLMTTHAAPSIARSTAVAGFNAAGSLGFLLGPLCCGALLHAGTTVEQGYVLAFAVAGLTEIACVLLLLPAMRRALRDAAAAPPG